MKAILTFLACAFASTLFSQSNIQQSLSVNGTGNAPDPSAQLDVSANNKGMLVPRMNSGERTAITAANALLVFDSDTKSFWFFDSAAAAWREIRAGNIAALADADGNTKIQVEESPNEDIIRFDLDGSERMVLRKNGVGNSARLEFPNTFLNTFIGFEAGKSNTSGGWNTANGANALITNTSGSQNTATGSYALVNSSEGSGNTANGYTSLGLNLTGDNNTANGAYALYSNSTGYSNVGIGVRSLYSNTSRGNLVAVGDSALYNNGTGATMSIHSTSNTALGSKALFSNTTGYSNTAIGKHALFLNTTGFRNTSGGDIALGANSTGTENTAFGYGALNDNTTGTKNTALGLNALNTNSVGSQNTAIGFNAYFTVNNLSNTTCIGYNSGSVVNASNRIEIGNPSVSAIAGQVNFSVYSDARIKTQVQENVPGLAFITKLRPVTYHLDIHKQNDLTLRGKEGSPDYPEKYDIEKKQMTGFIAQEVEAAAKAVGYDFSGVEKGADEVGMYSVKYAEFVVPLVRAVQEMDARDKAHQVEMEALKAENATLKAQLDKITAALAGAGIAVEK